jgi:hypothetical protein
VIDAGSNRRGKWGNLEGNTSYLPGILQELVISRKEQAEPASFKRQPVYKVIRGLGLGKESSLLRIEKTGG